MKYVEFLKNLPNSNIEHHTIHSLLMKQADRINELEQMLDDAEYEIEEIEQENRRLKCSQ